MHSSSQSPIDPILLRPVTVAKFMDVGQKSMQMELVAGHKGVKKRIHEAAINRPGLALSGFLKHFANRRIQVIGMAEHAHLSAMAAADRQRSLEAFFAAKIPCVVFTRHKRVFPEAMALAEKHGVPLIRNTQITKDFVNAATLTMENLVAPRKNVVGTMVEIMGIGLIIEGRPGMGKSETALGLIKKGYALVSDDVTAMRRDSSGALIGSPVDATRYHMEIRGMGIIHVPSLFGVAAVRQSKKLDLVATLVEAKTLEMEDRSGMVRRTKTILGVQVPQVLIGIAPGRDIAGLVETAALDCKLRLLGHDAAKELDERLMALLTEGINDSE
ncbi:MAG: HPr(Ser) kinase/phosphatase [Verrucomicrobia bacterium]|nr:HPr(Ser) kinase/phosphatase [Verrucomicrobiota bacterium]